MGRSIRRVVLSVVNVLITMVTNVYSEYLPNETLIHIVNVQTTTGATSEMWLKNDSQIPYTNITTWYTDAPPSFLFYSGAKKVVTKTTNVIMLEPPLCNQFVEASLAVFHDIPVFCHNVFRTPACLQDENYGEICNDGQPLATCNMHAPAENTVSTAVHNIIKHLNWKWILIIFDDENERRARLIQTNISSSVFVLLFRIEQSLDTPKLQETLYEYYTWTHKYKNILILCSNSTQTLQILTEASSFDDLHNNKTSMMMFSRWLLVVEEGSLENNLTNVNLDNVVIVTEPPTQPTVPNAIIETIKSTMACLTEEENKTYSEFNPATLESSRRKFVQFLTKDCECWERKIFCLVYTENGRELSEVGHFDYTGSLDVYTDLFVNENFVFNKRLFRVGTMLWAPYVQRSDDNTTQKYTGLCIDLLEQLAKVFNFTYEIEEPERNFNATWSKDIWSGFVETITRGEIDMILAPLLVSADKELLIDFTLPFHHGVSVGVFRKPDPEKSKWLTLIKPFKWEVLVCIGVSLVTSTVLLTIIQMTQTEQRQGNLGEVFQSCLWYIYGALLSHGCSLEPATLSGRILVGFWWLFCLVISASYSGILIAFLTVELQTAPFQTLAELVAQSEYSWGTLGGTAMLEEYNKSTQSDIRALVRGLTDPEQTSTSVELHKNKVLQGSYVFFSDKETLLQWTRQYCDLALLKESFSPFKFSVGLPKNSPYTDLFSNKILAIQSSGLVEMWKRHWWPQRNMCVKPTNARNRPIQLSDLQSIFYVAVIGLVLASIILILEKLKAFLQNYNNKNDNT